MSKLEHGTVRQLSNRLTPASLTDQSVDRGQKKCYWKFITFGYFH